MELFTKERLEDIRYKNLIAMRIRKKYSIDDEISILRQKDTKPEEYEEWSNYVENVKSEVKKILHRNS